MRIVGWTVAAVAVCSIANVATAQCLCDEQCPEEALCRQGRCFEARGAGPAEATAPGTPEASSGAAADAGGSGGGTGMEGAPAGVEASAEGGNVEASAGGVDVGGSGDPSLDASAGGLGVSVDASDDVDADSRGDVEGAGDATGDADLDGTAATGHLDGNAVDGDGVEGSVDPDVALRSDPDIDPSAEVEPLGADYTVPIAALVGLGTAFVATAVGAIAFGGGIDISVVPVAGPVIKFAQDIPDGLTVGTALQLSSGIGQVGALTTAVLGFLMATGPECSGVAGVACGERSLALTPLVSDDTIGMGAGWTF